MLRRHAVILFVPIALIAASSWLLVRDFREKEDTAAPTEPSLAKVKNSSGDVKRKPEKRMVWFELKSRQDLFKKDSVRTAKGSNAVIQFSDGGVIEIGENSLIVLEKSKDNKIAIDFVNGNILSKGGGKDLVLRSKGMTMAVGSAEVQLSAEKDKGVQVDVKSGEVQVESEGKSVSIAENQKGVLTDEGMGEVVAIPFKLGLPDRNALVFTTREKSKIDFQWENLAKTLKDGAVLEVSTEREFVKLVKSIKAGARTEITDVGLLPGSYYWRVREAGLRSGSSSVLVSEVRNLEVRERMPIRLIEPASNKSVKFAGIAPRMIFQWTGPEYFEKYRLELASDPDFKDLIRTEEIEGATQATVALEKPGSVYWRVRGASSRTELKEDSELRVLVLNKLAKLDPPEPLAPKSGASIPSKDDQATVNLRWTHLEEATEYLVEVSHKEDFGDGVETFKTQQPTLDFKARKLGRVFWRVSALDLDKAVVKAQKSLEFVIVSSTPLTLAEPKNRAVFEYLTEKPKVELKWEKEPVAKAYEIEIARDIGFKSEVSRVRAAEASAELKELADGVHYWRIRALDGSDSPFRTSGHASFEIKARELLNPPKLGLPGPDFSQASLVPEDVEIEFSWEAVADAQEYELVLKPVSADGAARAPAAGGTPPELLTQRFKGTRGVMRKLAADTYAWGVRTVDTMGRPGKLSALRRITVKQEDVLPPPEVEEPEIRRTRK